ncbi:MAG: chromosome segregation protein SMC [Thermomicrobiales bacterium]|nr:chromosome segregation protein SMC [Thermomicrobiales bacterium]
MTADAGEFRAPRLTKLEVQGFKSFLNRTTLVFEPGITAVVGPNGSGKSNVADALRWVLGEQGQAALRARKTEEVIFAGGQGRAPAGMAEATLVFDNTEGWLPTEFTEVAVTRRAFRTGESQYLINGRRVRLKDVAQLTASLGQSHVVVGQGLVDAALSLRAEERRGLFEHAADLTGLRLKVAEAERSLAETDSNVARLTDLLVELEPRLRTLERAAKQAREWQGLRDRLRELQGAHYQQAWGRASIARAAAEANAEEAERAAAAARAQVITLTQQFELAGEAADQVRTSLAQLETRRAALVDQLSRATHERDLTAARIDALNRRRADMDDARLGLDEQVANVAADLARLAVDLRDLERTTAETREHAAGLARAQAAGRQRRAELEKRLVAAARTRQEADRREGELQRRRAALEERVASMAAEQQRQQSAIAERAARLADVSGDAEAAADVQTADAARIAEAAQGIAALGDDLAAARERSLACQREQERLRHAAGDAMTRLDVLRRLQESGAGLFAGVKAVTGAARAGEVTGVLGTVAELIEVPAEYEVAVEVALGGRLQDVVMASWRDAEHAIGWLKRRNAGRATFQPLDTVRASRSAVPAPVQRLPGYRGTAAELIRASDGVEMVALALLGRALVVDDLETTRAALRELGTGWSVVTLGGEIARSGGSVTGGSAVRESGALGRERELRELPDLVARLQGEAVVAAQATARAEDEAAAVLAQQRQAEAELSGLRAAAEERRRQQERLRTWLSELAVEQERAERRQRELANDEAAARQALAEIELALAQLGASVADDATQRDALEAELRHLAEETGGQERAASDEGRRLAGLEERLRGERRREAGLRGQERALADELSLRGERLAQVDRERGNLEAQFAALVGEAAATEQALAAEDTARGPLREGVAAAEREATRLGHALQAARGDSVERDRERDHAGFAWERAEQEWEALAARIREDLDLADADEVLRLEVAATETSEADREREITRLRERLRRVGYVGDDAVADYERERSQQANLREQLEDVQNAAAALRTLLADLRQTMRSRFEDTFAQVAAEFAAAAEHHDSRVEVRPGAQEPLAQADRARTAQILRILLDNALKHTAPGTEIEIATASTPTEACLTVSDDGPGIDPRSRDRIFDRFYTADSVSGSGLGLAIARRIARAMNGDVVLAPRRGRGATFSLILPPAGAAAGTELSGPLGAPA